MTLLKAEVEVGGHADRNGDANLLCCGLAQHKAAKGCEHEAMALRSGVFQQGKRRLTSSGGIGVRGVVGVERVRARVNIYGEVHSNLQWRTTSCSRYANVRPEMYRHFPKVDAIRRLLLLASRIR